MTTIKLKHRASTAIGKEGTLFYQVIHEREICRIKSKYKILRSEWDETSATIVIPAPRSARYKFLAQTNADVRRELQLLEAIAAEMENSGQDFCSRDVAEEFRRRLDDTNVLQFLQEQRTKQEKMERSRRGEILRSTINKLTEFRNGIDFPFSMFNTSMMESFETFMKNKGLKRNTIGFYMRTLRSYYNLAVEEGVAEENHPFRKVYKSKDKTIKRALSLNEIRRIKELDLSAKPNLDFARDMLLFSFYARGMSFVDMAFLKKSDLKDGHFVYSRRKTGQCLCVEWVEQMQQILDKYEQNKTRYLLPIITQKSANERRQYLTRTQSISRNLKNVGRLAKVSGTCTMYRARHSWATLARYRNIPISVISEALGHDSEKTTEIYLDSIQTSVVDKVNRLLIKDLL